MTALLAWTFLIIAAMMLLPHRLASFSEEILQIGGELLRVYLRKLMHTELNPNFPLSDFVPS